MADDIAQETAECTVAEPPETFGGSPISALPTNGKRKAETELEKEMEDGFARGSDNDDGDERDGGNASAESKPMSKNQLKRLRRREKYQEFREDRKAKRKDKRHAKQERKRVERDAKIAAAEATGVDPQTVLRPEGEPWRPFPVPIAFIIDCDFEEYMREPEIVSLSSQITRSYSVNRKGKYQAHLLVGSWKGKLKTRFETVLNNMHRNWKGVHIIDGDFCEAAKKARTLMAGPEGGEVIDVIKPREDKPALVHGDGSDSTPPPELESDDRDGSIIYLSSDSPYVLERLEPNTSYVIGGLVDRNREKGLCYRRANERKVRTAKLPIGEYMAMQSRYVLTTNQVVEIMVKWLECGDWGDAFMSVIPKRKGGILKNQGSQTEADDLDNGDEEATTVNVVGDGADADAAEAIP